MSFFTELKRRNVFRVGAAYAIVAWLLIQVADTLFPTFGAPDWVMPVFSVLVMLGFPIAVILAWAFELTPEGIKPTHQVGPQESVTRETGHKLNNLITFGLLTLLILVSVDQYILEQDRSVTSDEILDSSLAVDQEVSNAAQVQEPQIVIEDKSIAVLPLDDFGAGGEDAYFADGLTEEILNALSRTPDLMVASRTSSFQYKDQLVDIQEVADALGVAHILEGSVRRSSTRLRITVQLIRASDGFHLWSQNYDRQPEDIIEVQEDIAFRIAMALQTAMDPDALAQMVQAGTRSIAAYNDYLQAIAILSTGGFLSRDSYDLFESARVEDPEFAAAHAGAAEYWRRQMRPNIIRGEQATREEQSVDEMYSLFSERIRLAVNNSSVPDQLRYRSLEALINLNYRTAYDLAQQYIELLPNNNEHTLQDAFVVGLANLFGENEKGLAYIEQLIPQVNIAEQYSFLINNFFYIRQYEQGRRYSRQGIDRFPLTPGLLYQSHRILLWGGYIEEARELLSRLSRLSTTDLPESNIRLAKLRQSCADQDIESASTLFEEVMQLDDSESGRWIALHLMGRTEDAVKLLQHWDQETTLYPLATYLTYPFFEVAQYPNLQSVLQREGVNHVYESIPFACNR